MKARASADRPCAFVCAFVLPTARSFTQDTGLSTVTRRTPVSPHVSLNVSP